MSQRVGYILVEGSNGITRTRVPDSLLDMPMLIWCHDAPSGAAHSVGFDDFYDRYEVVPGELVVFVKPRRLVAGKLSSELEMLARG